LDGHTGIKSTFEDGFSPQLYADILMDKEREVQPSDSMDIQLLSAAIPACHYVMPSWKDSSFFLRSMLV